MQYISDSTRQPLDPQFGQAGKEGGMLLERLEGKKSQDHILYYSGTNAYRINAICCFFTQRQKSYLSNLRTLQSMQYIRNSTRQPLDPQFGQSSKEGGTLLESVDGQKTCIIAGKFALAPQTIYLDFIYTFRSFRMMNISFSAISVPSLLRLSV